MMIKEMILMTLKTLKQNSEIDAAAERAGGYVANPAELTPNKEGEDAFTAMRQFSREKGIPMSKLNASDFVKKSS
jgi:hypothetical protein